MIRFVRLLSPVVAFALAQAAQAAAGDVQMLLNGAPAKPGDYAPADVKSLVLDNGLVKITFGLDAIGDFSATSVVVKGQELAGNLNGIMPRDQNAQRSFYHDFSGSNGILRADLVRIIKNTPDLVHFEIVGNNNPRLEDHFVMLKGESGIHPYVIVHGPSNGEMRTMYRFDMKLLDHVWTPERSDQQISYAYLTSISDPGNVADETWRLPAGNPAGLPAGSVYSKYDWCLYYSEAPMFGHFGHGFGAFFMPVSTESYAGGPLRQDLAVHQDALILNYIGGGHLSSGGGAGGRNGIKLHGPWFVYFNTGATPDAIIKDALSAAEAQKKQWPYKWMEEPYLFPLDRTTVTGQLKISHNRPASHAYVILAQPANAGGGRGGRRGGGNPGAAPAENAAPANASAFDDASPIAPARNAGIFGQAAPEAGTGQAPDAAPVGGGRRGGRGGNGGGGTNTGQVPDRAAAIANQGGDFIYYVKADADGKFTLPNVRQGTYTLYAWQTQGPITQSFAKDGIEVKGSSLNLGTIDWDPPYHANLLWQIGKPDRLAGEYKLGNGPRAALLLRQVPNDLTFTIGKSKEIEDWYFGQHTGTWTVKFNLDKTYTGNGYLTIAVAGGGGSANLSLNGQPIGTLSYNDDGSVRRSANRSGRYGRNEIVFPASLFKQGENTLTLEATTSFGGNGLPNGLMYDTLVMEAD